LKDPIQSDVLILGCGIAGGTAALALADAGLDVLVVTRATEAEDSNTAWAQGGIIYTGHGDSPELLAQDIVNAGAGLCHAAAVRTLAEEGPRLVESILIDRLGVPFDRKPDGSFALGREGGHSLPRILHATDATGRAIEAALVAQLEAHPRIRLLTRHTAVDLLTPAHHGGDRRAIYNPLSCVGAYVLHQDTGSIVRCFARATILATGGFGQIFLRTTNPAGARGDGLAMAYRAGARVINTEYVQFHPTAFYHRNAPCFLITEAVRGAGARLTDENRQPFMDRYDPEWKDLAPRDVVARSIHSELLSRGVPNVYLDLASYIPAERIMAEFPEMYRASTSHATSCRWCPPRTTPVAASGSTITGKAPWSACMPLARLRAPDCTAQTGWRVPRCSRGSSGVTARRYRSPPSSHATAATGTTTFRPGSQRASSCRTRR